MATLAVVILVPLANILLRAAAAADKQPWADIMWPAFLVPVANGTLLIAALVCLPLIWRRSTATSLGVYVLISIVLPVGAVFVPWPPIRH